MISLEIFFYYYKINMIFLEVLICFLLGAVEDMI